MKKICASLSFVGLLFNVHFQANFSTRSGTCRYLYDLNLKFLSAAVIFYHYDIFILLQNGAQLKTRFSMGCLRAYLSIYLPRKMFFRCASCRMLILMCDLCFQLCLSFYEVLQGSIYHSKHYNLIKNSSNNIYSRVLK